MITMARSAHNFISINIQHIYAYQPSVLDVPQQIPPIVLSDELRHLLQHNPS